MTLDERAEIAGYRKKLAEVDDIMERGQLVVQVSLPFAIVYFPVWCIVTPAMALLRWMVNDIERMRLDQ